MIVQQPDQWSMPLGDWFNKLLVEEEKIEMYQCPSYYDDDRILQDCKCGKCAKKEAENLRSSDE
jgi:hypothetical protein